MRKPKRLIFVLAGLMVAMGTTLSTAGPASAAGAVSAAPAPFLHCIPFCPMIPIQNYGSGKCITPVPVDGNYAINGLDIEQFSCTTLCPFPRPNPEPQCWLLQRRYEMTISGQTVTIFRIINDTSDQCLDDRDGRTRDGSPVQQWTCNDTSTTMQWFLGDSLDGTRQFRNLRAYQNGGSQCLDVAGGSGSDGAVLQLYHCTAGNPAQHFSVPSFAS